MRCVAFDAFAKELSTNFSKGDLVRLSDVTIKERNLFKIRRNNKIYFKVVLPCQKARA